MSHQQVTLELEEITQLLAREVNATYNKTNFHNMTNLS